MATATSMRELDVARLSGSLGAEVRGIALENAGPEDAERIEALLMEHQVLLFPDQRLDPDGHIAFGRLFGELESHPNLQLGAERPEFFELRANGGAGAIAAFRDIYWANTDNLYDPDVYQGDRPDFDDFVPLRYTVTYPRERTYGLTALMRFGAAVR
jgi:alpha-ketoglutarate-dependent taurine dioxygenase